MQDYASATTRGDRLLIIISSYGECVIGLRGAVNVGYTQNGDSRRLILQLVAGCPGGVTIIVNICYSGYWVEEWESMRGRKKLGHDHGAV